MGGGLSFSPRSLVPGRPSNVPNFPHTYNYSDPVPQSARRTLPGPPNLANHARELALTREVQTLKQEVRLAHARLLHTDVSELKDPPPFVNKNKIRKDILLPWEDPGPKTRFMTTQASDFDPRAAGLARDRLESEGWVPKTQTADQLRSVTNTVELHKRTLHEEKSKRNAAYQEKVTERIMRDRAAAEQDAIRAYDSKRRQRRNYEETCWMRQEKEWISSTGGKSPGECYRLRNASQIHSATGHSDPLPRYRAEAEAATHAARAHTPTPDGSAAFKNLHLVKSPDARAVMAHLPPTHKSLLMADQKINIRSSNFLPFVGAKNYRVNEMRPEYIDRSFAAPVGFNIIT